MMSEELLVVKFGGSVLDGGPAIRRAAEAVKREYNAGRPIVVVVSAMKGVTDKLLSAAEAISPHTPLDVIDHIIGLGEEQSVRLMAAALRSVGVDAVEVTPSSPSWPIVTDETHGNADPIIEECKSRAELGLEPIMERGKVPVICGFVGRSLSGKITTLGRGGSDTTAVLLAYCLGADELVLVKDVEGIYSADPYKVKDARPIEALDAWEAHLLASTGAKVLHSKVFKYKPGDLKIRVVSNSGTLREGGTVIRGTIPHLEVETYEGAVLGVTIVGDTLSNPEALTRISQKIREKGGKILCLAGEELAATFYVDGDSIEVLKGVHSLVASTDCLKAVSVSENLALTTVRGGGLGGAARLIQKVIGPLASRGIDICGMLMGYSSISILVNWEKREEVSQLIREALEEA